MNRSEKQTIFFTLAFAYFTTIPLEMIICSTRNSSRITLFDYIRSLVSTLLFQILFGSVLIVIYLTKRSFAQLFHLDPSMLHLTLSKFFEIIPLLLDMSNLLSIYLYKIQWNAHQYPSHRWSLSLVLCFIRLMFTLDIIRERFHSSWKQRVMVIGNVGLFILVNITIVRDLPSNIFSIFRKIVFALLIFRLHRSVPSRTLTSEQLYVILLLRWILSMVLMNSTLILTLRSMSMDEDGKLIPIDQLLANVQVHCPVLSICMIIIFIIHLDRFHDRKTHEKTTKKISRTCAVCLDNQQLTQFDSERTPACRHMKRNVCDSCLFQHVRQQIQITFTDEISCPEGNCQRRLDHHTVRNILLLGGDQQLIERYDRSVVLRQLEQMEEFIWCANPTCRAGQLNEGGIANTIVVCYHCQQKTCFQHRIQWHEGMTCEEFDRHCDPKYKSSRRWLMKHSKKCPGCSSQIEKNEGCDHMTCIKCRQEFCWLCLADFQLIRRDGNHRHNKPCKYYVAHIKK